MFEESLVESAALLHTRNRWPAVLSLSAQLFAAALILTLPLLHPELLPAGRSLSATLSPPAPPAPPPPPVHLRPASAASQPAASPASNAPSTPALTDLIHVSGPPVEAPPLGIVDLNFHNASLPPGINTAPRNSHITVAPASKTSPRPLNVSSGVSAGNLIAPIRPDYPTIARAAHVEGTVVIDAIISRSGAIQSARILSGPPMLQPAALAAVRNARYHPFLLNGQPTEVQTTITINFRMGS